MRFRSLVPHVHLVPCLCLATLVGALSPDLAHAAATPATARPDLTGRVISKEGQPVTDASIFIYTAGPRVGPGDI